MTVWSDRWQIEKNTNSKRQVLLMSWELTWQPTERRNDWVMPTATRAAVRGGIYGTCGISWLLCNRTAKNQLLLCHINRWKMFSMQSHRTQPQGLTRVLPPTTLLKTHANFPSSSGCRNNLALPSLLPESEASYVYTTVHILLLPCLPMFDSYAAAASMWRLMFPVQPQLWG